MLCCTRMQSRDILRTREDSYSLDICRIKLIKIYKLKFAFFIQIIQGVNRGSLSRWFTNNLKGEHTCNSCFA